jgi:hypothetical protein
MEVEGGFGGTVEDRWRRWEVFGMVWVRWCLALGSQFSLESMLDAGFCGSCAKY